VTEKLEVKAKIRQNPNSLQLRSSESKRCGMAELTVVITAILKLDSSTELTPASMPVQWAASSSPKRLMRKVNSPSWSEISIGWVLIAIICLAVPRAPGEDKQAWQAGTVVQVKAHEGTSGDNGAAKQCDVSIQVGKKIYLTLYTLKKGDPDFKNYVGMSRMVLIEGDTLTLRDLLGRPHLLKIVSSKDAPEAKAK
jgi:hypothetical protein